MDVADWRGIVFGFAIASVASTGLPRAAISDEIRSGAAEYRTRCASCHGDRGAGDGPAASALRTPPPDLRVLTKANDGVFPEKVLETVIDGRKTIRAHGNFEMPVWGRELSPLADGKAAKRIAAIIEYLRSIQE